MSVSENPAAAIAADIDDEPYPGLRSFRRDETHIFFGREGTTNEMVDRLARHRFLAVTGTSGSGKSSLVRTGLLDALTRGLLAEAGADWRVVDFRPGVQPLTALTAALINTIGGPYTEQHRPLVEARLARGPLGLIDWLDEIKFPPQTNLLLLVDQFEELFRYRRGRLGEEVDAFVALILASARQRGRRVYVVMTMRSDFLGECSQFAGLAEAINDGQFLTPRLTREQCQQAIEGPAMVYGGRVEKALVTRLLNDMGTNADQLPLLQHVLMLMWRAASKQTPGGVPMLTLAAYEALGGIITAQAQRNAPADSGKGASARVSNGALSDHADQVLAELTPEQQRLTAILFRGLTESEGAAGRDVRRPVALGVAAEVAGVPPADLIGVIEAFRAPGRYFLTPAPPAPLAADTVIDISHESLIRQWVKLRDWAREEFQSAETYRHLEKSAKLWQQGDAGLLTMPYLGLALAWSQREHPNDAWAARYGDAFPLAMKFLDASRRRHHTRRLVGGSAVALGILSVSAFATFEFRSAQFNRVQADLQASQVDLKAAQAALQATDDWLRRDRVADTLKSQGDLAGALAAYRDVLATAQDKVKATPDDPRWLGFVALSSNSVGDVLTAQGDLDGAVAAFRDARASAQTMIAKAPDNNDGPTQLIYSLQQLADALTKQGKTADALAAYRDEFMLAKDQAQKLPNNPYWQRQLIFSSEKIGDMLKALSMIDEAIAAYEDERAIATALAARFPSNSSWRRSLAISRERTGDALKLQSEALTDAQKVRAKQDDALAAYNDELGLVKTLVADDPDSSDSQRMLAVCNERIGDLLMARNMPEQALAAYRAELAVATAQTAKDPASVDWQRILAISNSDIGDALKALNKFDEALAAYQAELVIATAQTNQDPSSNDWQRILAITHGAIGDTLRALNRLDEALAAYRERLVVAQVQVAKDSRSTDWQNILLVTDNRIGGLAYQYILARNFTKALEAADQAVGLAPDQLWIRANRAHALMFLGRVNEARAIYLQYRGRLKVLGTKSWEAAVLDDFAELRMAGLTNPLMNEIEQLFAHPG